MVFYPGFEGGCVGAGIGDGHPRLENSRIADLTRIQKAPGMSGVEVASVMQLSFQIGEKNRKH